MSTNTTSPLFDKVEATIDDALLVAFDGCHKMYLAMDAEQAAWFRAEYPHTVTGTPDEMLDAVKAWYAVSCPLKFVNAVSTNHADPNAGFVPLIEQGAEDNDEETYECDVCGEVYGEGEINSQGRCMWCADED